MAKTYRSWAELEDWSHGREFRRPHKRKSEQDWKREAEAVMADRQTEVFVIVNEWEDAHGNVGSSIVNGLWYASEREALTELRTIAELVDVQIPDDEFGFTVEDSGTLDYDEYYIQELTNG